MSDRELSSSPPPSASPSVKDKSKKKKKKSTKKAKDVKEAKTGDDGLDSLMAELKLESEAIDGLDDITAALDDLGQSVGATKPKSKKKKKKSKSPSPPEDATTSSDPAVSQEASVDPDPTVSLDSRDSHDSTPVKTDNIINEVLEAKSTDITPAADLSENATPTKSIDSPSKPPKASDSVNPETPATPTKTRSGSGAASKFDSDLFSVDSHDSNESAFEKIAREAKEIAEATYAESVKDAELIAGSQEPVISSSTEEPAPDSLQGHERQIAMDDYEDARYEAEKLLGNSSDEGNASTTADAVPSSEKSDPVNEDNAEKVLAKNDKEAPTTDEKPFVTKDVSEKSQPAETSATVDGLEPSAQGHLSSPATPTKSTVPTMSTPPSTKVDKDVKPQSDAVKDEKPIKTIAKPKSDKKTTKKAAIHTATNNSSQPAKEQIVLELGENLYNYKDDEHHLSEIAALKSLRIDTKAVNAYLAAAAKEKQSTLTTADEPETKVTGAKDTKTEDSDVKQADVDDEPEAEEPKADETTADDTKSKHSNTDDVEPELSESKEIIPEDLEEAKTKTEADDADTTTKSVPEEDEVAGLNLSNKSVASVDINAGGDTDAVPKEKSATTAAADTSLDIDDLINELQGDDVEALLRELDADEKSTQARSILKPSGSAAAAATSTAKKPSKADDDLDFEVSQDEIRKHLATLPIYLYTSLAGGMQIVPRTNRLALILQANDIKFEYKDLGTDAEAKKIWKRYANGPNGMRTIPGVVRGDEVIGDWKEIDEANEEYKVRELIYETL
ncbi:hypothetical protein DIURU_000069 [Diutina rugosa]|uniref:Glutaredoxin domain-containing protein n=1 Tax=Diutina rugosa TaxID=5481 RepID=A0A642V4Y5_DIURU|nr:uncharacterized protein DIURU_000069 [Diutina rugosa]KAA8908756.1 hypothetical protein DIURU_000069 [Diutina rugosa]